MGGCAAIVDDWELPEASSSTEAKTLVLFGRTGNGKSATGNSILGRKAFKSKGSSSGVTHSCELQTTQLQDGQVLNVIDTPGIFDSSKGSSNIGNEIIKCISLAKEGTHAILLGFSVRTRFSDEEAVALQSLRNLFGEEIIDYMIVVFTGGDCLEEDDETIDDYLGNDCPEQLKKIIQLCQNRFVVFDNKTKNESQRIEQVQQLMSLVNLVIKKNGGRAYSNEIFEEMKIETMKLNDLEEQVKSFKEMSTEKELLLKEMHISYQEQLQKMSEMDEVKLKESTSMLEKQLKEEQAARAKAEKLALESIKKKNDEIRHKEEMLEKQLKEEQAARAKAEKLSCESKKKMNDENKRHKEEMLEKQLKKEQAARAKAEKLACESKKKLNDENKRHKEEMLKAHNREREANARAAAVGPCVIM